MPTAATGDSAYATGADFVLHFDYRTAAQLLVDAEPDATPLTQAQVEAHETLAELLAAASGEVESCVLVGKRYVVTSTQNDLADLEGNSLALLKRLVCTLAAEMLFERRPALLEEIGPRVEWARRKLKDVGQGVEVFGYAEHQDAGLLEHHMETVDDEVERQGVNVQAERLFGMRGWRRRID